MTRALTASTLILCLSVTADAAEPGKAVGTVTISGTAATLKFATDKKIEGLFDPQNQNTLVVLSDSSRAPSGP